MAAPGLLNFHGPPPMLPPDVEAQLRSRGGVNSRQPPLNAEQWSVERQLPLGQHHGRMSFSQRLFR